MKTSRITLPGLLRFMGIGLLSTGLTTLPLQSADYTMPAATATVVNGFVVGVAVTSGGSGYTTAPDVSFSGGGGSGAAAQAVIANGSVTEVRVTFTGSNYSTVPRVVFTPPLPSSIEAIQMVPMLTIQGTVGSSNQIQYREDLGDTNAWVGLTNLVLQENMTRFVDTSAPPAPRRFYQVVNLSELPAVNPHPDWLVWIPPGSFTMGSPASEEGRYGNEGPQTGVTISQGFWMSRHETKQSDYWRVIGSNPSYFGSDTNRPVEQVSWQEATNYCAKFTEEERLAGRLPVGHVYRLPTEAEWEYACRAGTTTRFHYGDDPAYSSLGQYAWYAGSSTHPVGLKLPNPWGLYDVYGNVWEWCADAITAYPGGSAVDHFSRPNTNSQLVARGGNWGETGGSCRSAMRGQGVPTLKHWGIGFRVILAAPLP